MVRLLAAVLACLLLSLPALAGQRIALVLTADDYQNLRTLKNAGNDGRAVEAALEKVGFEVSAVRNGTLKRLKRALRDFEEDADGADVALIFFSGHGVELSGDNRLLPVDADPSSLDRLQETSLGLNEVRDAVTAGAKIGLVVLDACRSDPFGGTGGDGRSVQPLKQPVAKALKPGLGRMGRAENVLFSFSAAPGETASDGTGDNSPFSAALAKFLPTEGLEIRSVLTLVQQEVYDLTRGHQLPYIENGLPKLFFAAEGGRPLPERDRLLLAMADITPALRGEVEAAAASADMPLAPLYAALITADGSSLSDSARRAKLKEAAQAFVQVRAGLRKFASADPKVAELRGQAEAKLALGSFEEARALLAQAAGIDDASREDLKSRLVERTLSEADTHYLSGGAARAALRYDLAIGDYEKAAELYGEIEGFGLPDEARYQQVLSLELIGTMQQTVGNLKAATGAFGRMVEAAERRAGHAPDNNQYQRDLIVARDKLAAVRMDQGDIAGAIRDFEASRATLSALIDRDPQFQYLRDLGFSFNKTGDARRALGLWQEAVVDHRKALKIAGFLVAELPGDDSLRRDVGIAHSKIGQALRLGNDFAGALAEQQASLGLAEELAAKRPDDAEMQRDLSVTLNAIGDLRRLGGDNKAALDPFRRSVEITRKLVARDPGDTQGRRDLGIGLNKLGGAMQEAGDLAAALQSYESALAIAQYLAEIDPTNAEWQRDLSIAFNRVGDILLLQGNRSGAGGNYQAGAKIAEAQFAADPENVQRAVDAAFSRFKLGQAGIDAAGNFHSALDLLKKLKAESRLPAAYEGWIAMVEKALGARAE